MRLVSDVAFVARSVARILLGVAALAALAWLVFAAIEWLGRH